jgi:hypothetical protein
MVDGCWVDSLCLTGAPKGDADTIGSVLMGGIPLNTEAAGAGWTSFAGAVGGDEPNDEIFRPEPVPKTDVLLVLAGDVPNNGDVEAGLAKLSNGNGLVSSGPIVRFSFSPSHRGFSASVVGVACAELTFGCGEITGSGLLSAAELAKKFGTLRLVVGGSVTDVGLANATEFAKKFGMPDPVPSAGATEAGLLSAAELAKKLGIPDAVEGGSVTAVLAGSGVGVVRDIDGGCDIIEEAEGCAKKEDTGLGICSGSLEAEGVGAKGPVDACEVGILVSENGNAAMGGSFAVVRSC